MKVSVLIPVYNQQELIIKALDSIPNRDDIEIIVCDDGSTDNTFETITTYLTYNETKNIVLLYNKENKGVGYTVNKLYDNATGEYVVLLGSDDYFYKDEFNKAINELDGTDLVYFDLIDNNGYRFVINEKSKNTYCGSVKFMRREFIGETRCPEIRAREDYYFYNELLKKNPTEKFTNLAVKHYNFPREGSLINLASKGEI